MDQSAARRTLVLGTQHFTRAQLEEVRRAGQSVQIRVLGLASIADDVPPELALATIASVEVLGAFRASAAREGSARLAHGLSQGERDLYGQASDSPGCSKRPG